VFPPGSDSNRPFVAPELTTVSLADMRRNYDEHTVQDSIHRTIKYYDMKKTAAAGVEALDGKSGVLGRIKPLSKHIFAQISLRPKAKAIHRDVRDGSRLGRNIAHDLHAGVTLLSK